eukprot:14310946-Ditylum_brightwellii.AAC.1
MGGVVQQNLGLDYEELHKILNNIKNDVLSDKLDRPQQQVITLVGFYLLFCFVDSLKENRWFMTELNALLQYIKDGKEEDKELHHIVISLLEEFKGERGKHCHLLLLADVTTSGFKSRTWAERITSNLRGQLCVRRTEYYFPHQNWKEILQPTCQSSTLTP